MDLVYRCSKEGCNRTAVGKSKIDGKLYCDRYCQPDAAERVSGNIGATQLKPGQTIISVDGHATVKHEADEAFVHFEIQVDDATEDAAWRNGWAQDTKLQKALKGFFMEFNSETRVRLESEDRGDPSPPQVSNFCSDHRLNPNPQPQKARPQRVLRVTAKIPRCGPQGLRRTHATNHWVHCHVLHSRHTDKKQATSGSRRAPSMGPEVCQCDQSIVRRPSR